MTSVLLRTTLATLMAYAGGLLGVALGGSGIKRHLNLLVYAAMGALLAVTVMDVLPDAKAVLSWPMFLLTVTSGYFVFWFISRYVYHICPSCAYSSFDEETTQRLGQTAVLLMVALAIHSTMDGMAIVAGDAITGHPNFGVLFGVSFHKVPEGLALALLLIGAGYRRQTALLWTFAIEATTELGGLLGVFALHGASMNTLGLLFGHVGGGFLYLVFSTLDIFVGYRANRKIVLPAPSLLLSSGVTFVVTVVILWTLGSHFK